MRREKVKMLCLHQRCSCVTGRYDDIMNKSRKKKRLHLQVYLQYSLFSANMMSHLCSKKIKVHLPVWPDSTLTTPTQVLVMTTLYQSEVHFPKAL